MGSAWAPSRLPRKLEARFVDQWSLSGLATAAHMLPVVACCQMLHLQYFTCIEQWHTFGKERLGASKT